MNEDAHSHCEGGEYVTSLAVNNRLELHPNGHVNMYALMVVRTVTSLITAL